MASFLLHYLNEFGLLSESPHGITEIHQKMNALRDDVMTGKMCLRHWPHFTNLIGYCVSYSEFAAFLHRKPEQAGEQTIKLSVIRVPRGLFGVILTHWGRVTHTCVRKLTINGSDNGLSPCRRQAIISTSAGLLLIGPLGTNFSEISIGIQIFSFKKMHLKMSSAKWRPFCLGLNVLMWS